jgi:hypothetical protein
MDGSVSDDWSIGRDRALRLPWFARLLPGAVRDAWRLRRYWTFIEGVRRQLAPPAL